MLWHCNCVHVICSFRQQSLSASCTVFDRSSCSQLSQKVVQCLLFSNSCWEILLSVFRQIFYIPTGLIKISPSELSILVFNSKKQLYKVKFHDVRCESVMNCRCRLFIPVFTGTKIIKDCSRNAAVIVKNKVGTFLWLMVYKFIWAQKYWCTPMKLTQRSTPAETVPDG